MLNYTNIVCWFGTLFVSCVLSACEQLSQEELLLLMISEPSIAEVGPDDVRYEIREDGSMTGVFRWLFWTQRFPGSWWVEGHDLCVELPEMSDDDGPFCGVICKVTESRYRFTEPDGTVTNLIIEGHRERR